MILKTGFLEIDNVDVSEFVTQVDVPLGRETKDDSAMGNETRIFESGVKTFGLTATLKCDAAMTLDALFDGILDAGDPVPIVWRPSSGIASTSNPQRSADMVLESYTPPSGQWSEKVMLKISLKPAGELTRATA